MAQALYNEVGCGWQCGVSREGSLSNLHVAYSFGIFSFICCLLFVQIVSIYFFMHALFKDVMDALNFVPVNFYQYYTFALLYFSYSSCRVSASEIQLLSTLLPTVTRYTLSLPTGHGVQRRHPSHSLADGQGCVNLPQVGRRTRARRPQEDGTQGVHDIHNPRRHLLLHQATQVVRTEEQEVCLQAASVTPHHTLGTLIVTLGVIRHPRNSLRGSFLPATMHQRSAVSLPFLSTVPKAATAQHKFSPPV